MREKTYRGYNSSFEWVKIRNKDDPSWYYLEEALVPWDADRSKPVKIYHGQKDGKDYKIEAEVL